MLENEMRDEMVRLLRYANRQKVGAALGVSRASVSDWAAGRHITPIRLAQVRTLFDAPDTTKEPPPEWARRLAVRLRAHSAKLQVNDEDLARAAIEEAAEWAVGEESEARPQRSAGGESTAPGP